MHNANQSKCRFPVDPLDGVEVANRQDYRRRMIAGILESYNSNYDFLAEAIQNGVDALEDAFFAGLDGPFRLLVTINLSENWASILDTGIGMHPEQALQAFAPMVSFKAEEEVRKKRGAKHAYRGYKGVGLTFLAYGTDDIRLHSRQQGGELVKGRMKYGRAWTEGSSNDPAMVVEDTDPSPLDNLLRGTYVKLNFSSLTRPRSLGHLSATPEVWRVILRTRTAAGQILLGRQSVAPIQLGLHVVDGAGQRHEFEDLQADFLFPHVIRRTPPYRFLDLVEYWRTHKEEPQIPRSMQRQDGLHLMWDSQKIGEALTREQGQRYETELSAHSPYLYAFVPYQGSVWSEMNRSLTGQANRTHVAPGLVIAVNRQRLADVFDIEATRYVTFSRNVLVVVHFDEARPDQGRKTLQDELLGLAKAAADRAVQYLAKQRDFLRASGEAPTPQQRQIERDHEDWKFNVRNHARDCPIEIPGISLASEPLTEQDVVGLFHQLCAIGVIPGIRIYATSQSHTYDCLVEFKCSADVPGLRYRPSHGAVLGLSPFVLGEDQARYETSMVTVEFKNNLDGLVSNVDDPDSPKCFSHIQICVCWSTVQAEFDGYELQRVTEKTLDDRKFPGVTHVLRRDGDAHAIQVIMLKDVVELLKSGEVVAHAPTV